MSKRPEPLRFLICFAVLANCLFTGGCQVTPPGGENTDREPNDSFADAAVVELAADGSALISGSISPASDVDVYQLNSVQAGDLVVVEISRVGKSLRTALALFDDEAELIAEDTDTSAADPAADPVIEHSIRTDSSAVYVAVASNYVQATSGDYTLHINITYAGDVITPQRQVILLNFEGGHIVDPVFGNLTVGAFDADAIDDTYIGQTDSLKESIRQTFVSNFAAFDVQILTSDDELPVGVDYSEVIFGGYNQIAFGIAEGVDSYNQEHGDNAIIFTEAFDPSVFTWTPTTDQLGVAIGNVGSHEMGHLLGLNHVDDEAALMDAVSPADVLVDDQEFMRASLTAAIFPIGWQDSVELLQVTVGEVTSESPLRQQLRALKTYTSLDQLFLVSAKSSGSGLSFRSGSPCKCFNCAVRMGLAGYGPLAAKPELKLQPSKQGQW